MKFVIAQGARKRELLGPFGICASRDDFKNLRDQIDAWLADVGNGYGISYGFLFVQERRAVEMGPPNTHPEPWDDRASSAQFAEARNPRSAVSREGET